MAEEKKPNKTWIWILAVVLVIGSGIGSYFLLNQEQQGKYTGPVEKITVAAFEGGASAPIYIAEGQGFFENNGLDVTIKGYGSGKACADALIAGEADISTSSDAVLVGNSFDNPDLEILGTVAIIKANGLIARKDRGINSPKDLVGKKVGVTIKSTGEFNLEVMLLVNGLSTEDIDMVDLGAEEIVEKIVNGEIDAGFTWEPFLYNAKVQLGENGLIFKEPNSENFYFLLLTKDQWLKENPNTAKRFVKALIEAEDYIKENNEEAMEFIKDKFNYEQEFMDSILPEQEFTIVFPQVLLGILEDQARWRIDNNLTEATKVPNYLNFIYLDALEEVKPEAVTIIR